MQLWRSTNIYGYPQLFMDIHITFMEIHNAIVDIHNPQFIHGYQQFQLWIATIVFMDLHNLNCEYPQIY